MEEPKKPCGRLVYEKDEICDSTKMCSKCGSSLRRKFFGLIRTKKCIHPECDNYYRGV